MRKLNAFLVAGMLLCLVAHGLAGSLRLLGANGGVLKAVAWVGMAFVTAHVVVTAILTGQTLKARRLSGAGYFRDNLLFWARRVSGLAVAVPLVTHLVIFRAPQAESYRLNAFTAGRLISQILLIVSLALHVLLNVRPALIGFGVKDRKRFAADCIFILSALLLLGGVAFAVYYWRWAAV